MLIPVDTLSLREQLKLLEIANEGRSLEVRDHALFILNALRNSIVFHCPPQFAKDSDDGMLHG